MKHQLASLHKHYESIEHFLGVACPLLGAISVLDSLGLIRWAWAILVWMSCGHYTLYFYNIFPRLRHRPFTRGMFVFGVGMLWPLWCASRRHKDGLSP